MTKRRRLSIYKEIEKVLIQNKIQERNEGLCSLLEDQTEIFESSFIHEFPELYAQKPKNTHAYWWKRKNPLGTTFRLKAVRKAIELCKPVKRKV